VEIACGGGRGRTGTALACLAVLDGVPAEQAVAYTTPCSASHACTTSFSLGDRARLITADHSCTDHKISYGTALSVRMVAAPLGPAHGPTDLATAAVVQRWPSIRLPIFSWPATEGFQLRIKRPRADLAQRLEDAVCPGPPTMPGSGISPSFCPHTTQPASSTPMTPARANSSG
jgi:hypothetical protein